MTRKVKPPQERKSEIVQAARRLFNTRGYAKTTITEIIEDVDISKGLFYYYFGSKEEILDEIVSQLVTEDVAALEEIVDHPADEAPATLMQMLRTHRAIVTDTHGQIAVHLHGIDNPQIVIKTVRQVAAKVSPLFHSIVTRGINDGFFSLSLPPEGVEVLVSSYTFEVIFGKSSTNIDNTEQTFALILERSLGATPGSISGSPQPLSTTDSSDQRTTGHVHYPSVISRTSDLETGQSQIIPALPDSATRSTP